MRSSKVVARVAALACLGLAACDAIVGVHDLPFPADATAPPSDDADRDDATPDSTTDGDDAGDAMGADARSNEVDADAESQADAVNEPADAADAADAEASVDAANDAPSDDASDASDATPVEGGLPDASVEEAGTPDATAAEAGATDGGDAGDRAAATDAGD